MLSGPPDALGNAGNASWTSIGNTHSGCPRRGQVIVMHGMCGRRRRPRARRRCAPRRENRRRSRRCCGRATCSRCAASASTICRSGTIAASAPKAGHVLYVDSETGAVVGKSDLKDVCGLSSEGEHNFAASSGFGVIRYETAQAQVVSEHTLQDIAFDNHLRRIA